MQFVTIWRLWLPQPSFNTISGDDDDHDEDNDDDNDDDDHDDGDGGMKI